MGRRLARPQLRRPDGRAPGDGRHGRVLRRRRAWLADVDPAAPEPGRHAARARGGSRDPRLRRDPRDVDPGRPAPHRASPDVGAGPLGIRPDVRRAPSVVRRPGAPADPDRAPRDGGPVAARDRPRRSRQRDR